MKVAILTMFSGLSTTYSLVNVVADQIRMLLQANVTVKVLVSETCPDEERTGELVYEVPAGFTDFSIAYLEQFVDEDGNESTGDTFFVYFTAEDQTGVSA